MMANGKKPEKIIVPGGDEDNAKKKKGSKHAHGDGHTHKKHTHGKDSARGDK